MQLPELVWRRPLLVAASTGCLLGGLVGVLWPLPSPVVSGMEDRPMLSPARAAMQRYSEGDFATLRDGRLWSGSAGAQSQSETVRSWRLLGVVIRPMLAALVEADRKQVRIGIGQPLPDGTILRNVSEAAIEFERDNCTFQRSLYSREDVPIATADCPASNNANPPTRSTPSE